MSPLPPPAGDPDAVPPPPGVGGQPPAEAARRAQVLESMAVGHLSLDRDGRIRYVNAEAERALGRPRGELVGGVLREVFPATGGTDVEAGCRAAADTGRTVTFDAHSPPPLDAWYEVRATPEAEGVALYLLDITARHAAEAARDLAARRLSGLARATVALVEARDVQDLVAIVAEQGLSALGCDGGAVAVPDPADPTTLLSSPTASSGQGTRDAYARLPLDARLPVCVAATTGRRVLLADAAASRAFSPLMPDVEADTGCQAWASLPLRAGGQLLGVLTAGWRQPQGFPAEQVAVLEAFATQCAQALQRLASLEAERTAAAATRSMAEGLQRSLLTGLPEPDHLEITARYAPATTGAEVGGDWYDAFGVADGSTSLVIGDVTGHDQEAAAAMGAVRNVLRGIAHALAEPPAAVLSALDRAMRDLAVEPLTTAVLARVEQTPALAAQGLRQLRWSNAGHPPPLLLHPGGRAELLDPAPDLLLGLDPTTARHDHTTVLPPGASVLLYTDGLVERRGEGLQVGLERLRTSAERLARTQPALDAWCDALLAELVSDGADDDIALLALRTHPEDRPRPRA